jgi:hypothetical protein
MRRSKFVADFISIHPRAEKRKEGRISDKINYK